LQIYKRAISFFFRDWPLVAALTGLIVLIVAFGTLLAWPLAILLDAVLTNSPKSGWIYDTFLALVPGGTVARVAVLGFTFVALKFVLDLLSCLRTMLNNGIKYRGTVRVRRALFRRYHELGAAWHATQPMGDALFRMNNDTFGPFGVFDTLFTTAQQSATLFMVTAVMLTRSVPLTMFALALAPLMLGVNYYFGKRIKHRADHSRQIDANLLTAMQRFLATIGLVQVYNRQRHEEFRFSHALDQSTDASMSLHWQENLYPLAIQVIYGSGQAAVLAYGGYLVYQDQILTVRHDGFSIGDLLLFMGYFTQMLNPLSEVIGFSARVKTSIAASERIFAVLDREPVVQDERGAINLAVKPRLIEMRGVSFGYTPQQPILDRVNIRIEPGEMAAFIGASGSGKSTLINLLPRFYDPDAGTIKLGGHDIRSLTLASLRKHIVVVSQDNGLLAGSIAENIAYGVCSANDVEVKRAAERAGAARFIEALPEGYDTQITEGGKNLSGGQRQRLAIARALLTSAPILVFDEPTSALDEESEAEVLQTLCALKGERTIILITHRPECAAACDRIYRVENGTVVLDSKIEPAFFKYTPLFSSTSDGEDIEPSTYLG
jgi:ATP-binding cassette subfamily B protein